MKLTTIAFDQQNLKHSTYGNDQLSRQYFLPVRSNYLKIYLIEIDDSINPSDIGLEIIFHGSNYKKQKIYFSRIRTKFLHQQNKFILDAASIPYFKIDLSSVEDFTLKADANDQAFQMKFYCETDQQGLSEYNVVL
jgi:hypothetical protein